MMPVIEGQKCVRRRVEINGENYYLVLGSNFCMATVPWENRPDRHDERHIVESVCGALTAMMEEREIGLEVFDE